ncbi:MAG: DEAD/DEAH box helicase [Bacteroidia bacterium]
MSQSRGFKRYELHERVLDAIPDLGFWRPTEVQEKVIPLFIQKRNLIVEAPTGTGKTAAYGLPLISRLDLLKRSTQALVMVPSRELAIQVSNALRSFFAGDQLVVGAVYGGVPIEESFKTIKSHPHILVVVPGRLRDVMSHNHYDFLWRDIKFLIIDEGDKLLEMGFQKDFDELRSHVRTRVQVGFFSATISEDAETMIRERFSPIQSLRIPPRETLKNIRFYLSKAHLGQREAYLMTLLREQNLKQALVFAGKRSDILAITNFLRNQGVKAEAYYGNQEQDERKNILTRFKEGHIDFLVASDLAARGLDVPDLPAVINLNVPEEYDYYLHRVGRTGRAGNRGKVFNLVASDMEEIFLKNHHRQIDIKLQDLIMDIVDLKNTKIKDDHKWVKYHLSRGKRDKVRKGDIVGFLMNKAGLNTDEIGTITLYDAYSIFDMPQMGFENLKVQADLDPLKIKGKSVKIRRFQLDEIERKAESVKRLKRDRRKGPTK